MPIFPVLKSIYSEKGIEVTSGLNPWRYANLSLVSFTWFFKDGRSLTPHLGISLQEVYFLECLFSEFQPRNILIIGNSMGWSTFAIALCNPNARVIAVDAALDPETMKGIKFTNSIARERDLNLKAVKGLSPQDIPKILAEEFDGPVGFAFVDGYHTNEQIFLDFQAVNEGAADDCVWLFHDVGLFSLQDGLERIKDVTGLPYLIMDSTTSGMAIMFDRSLRPGISKTAEAFSASDAAREFFSDQAYKETYRSRHKFKRSLAKRINRLRGILGNAN